MLLQDISIHRAFVMQSLEGAASRGLDVHRLLKQAGIAPAVLQQTQARIPAEAFIRLQQQLMRELQDETVGLATRVQSPGTFSLLAHAVLHGATLGEVLSDFARYSNLLESDFATRMEQDEHTVRYVLYRKYGPAGDNHFNVETLTMTLFRYLCWLSRSRVPLLAVHFDYPAPEWSREYRSIFYAVPVHFNASNIALEFDRGITKLPVQRDARALKGFIARAPRDLFIPINEHSLSGRVRQFIAGSLDRRHVVPGIAEVSAVLGLHPQTLRRRLREEDTDYSEIRDAVRRDRALRMLGSDELSVAVIAERLGYGESGAFARAFRKWTGMTPLNYRQL